MLSSEIQYRKSSLSYTERSNTDAYYTYYGDVHDALGPCFTSPEALIVKTKAIAKIIMGFTVLKRYM